MLQYESFFVEIGLQIVSQEQKRLEPPPISDESAPIGLVSIIKVNEKAEIRLVVFDHFNSFTPVLSLKIRPNRIFIHQ